MTRRQRFHKPQAGTILDTASSLAAVAIGTAVPLGLLAKLVSQVVRGERSAAEEWDDGSWQPRRSHLRRERDSSNLGIPS
jgi:hypothetical protein